MKFKSNYADKFGNIAVVEKLQFLPYQGAQKREDGYRLSLTATYDNMLYHVSVHETKQEAINKMMEFSCGTWAAEGD